MAETMTVGDPAAYTENNFILVNRYHMLCAFRERHRTATLNGSKPGTNERSRRHQPSSQTQMHPPWSPPLSFPNGDWPPSSRRHPQQPASSRHRYDDHAT